MLTVPTDTKQRNCSASQLAQGPIAAGSPKRKSRRALAPGFSRLKKSSERRSYHADAQRPRVERGRCQLVELHVYNMIGSHPAVKRPAEYHELVLY